MARDYQYGFSEMHRDAMYNREKRQKKAATIVRVLCDYYEKNNTQSLELLDVGASTGIIDEVLSYHFRHVTGIDIDDKAISYAQHAYMNENLDFHIGDAMNIECPTNSYDVVICAQIYEHVPDARMMMREILRVLRPGGVCYFAAGNRLAVSEPHYNLPFLSIIPKPLAHLYLRMTGKGKHYYETHLNYWGLRRLVKEFELVDYTVKLIEEPQAFAMEYMVKQGSSKQAMAKFIANYIYWLMPGYVWLLRKPVTQ